MKNEVILYPIFPRNEENWAAFKRLPE